MQPEIWDDPSYIIQKDIWSFLWFWFTPKKSVQDFKSSYLFHPKMPLIFGWGASGNAGGWACHSWESTSNLIFLVEFLDPWRSLMLKPTRHSRFKSWKKIKHWKCILWLQKECTFANRYITFIFSYLILIFFNPTPSAHQNFWELRSVYLNFAVLPLAPKSHSESTKDPSISTCPYVWPTPPKKTYPTPK